MKESCSSDFVLIVEDDKKTAALVAMYLEKEGFKALLAHDGEHALELAKRQKPVFVILDLMLPKVDGWEVCRQLRSFSDVPILILTAREEEMERVLGLSLGADDYVVKPFSPRELVARVNAILRRTRHEPRKAQTPLSYRGLVLDPEKCKVTLNDRPVSLTLSEYRLLHALMCTPGKVFTRRELLDRLYPHGEVVIDRVIDVHIGKLREKIEEDTSRPRYILTVRGLGYRLSEGDEE
jgi:DNA-binding response OmpR family regulator